MEKLSLKEIQNISLEILKDVHSFCAGHNTTYFLAYGTLLGAIRHKGFIPWDDDVDIMMPRPDYEAFIKSYQSEKYHLFSQYEKDCLLPFSRVYDDTSSYVETRRPWFKKSKHRTHTGIWIDIFPVDVVAPDSGKEEERKRIITKAESRLLRYRISLEEFRLFKKKGLKFILGFLFRKLFVLTDYSSLKDIIAKYATIIPYEESTVCVDYSIISDYAPFPKELMQTSSLANFEDAQFFIPVGYDKLLRGWYGDYMKLPPIEDRKPSQYYIDFYRK